jgi:hypothetical protein
MIAINVQHSNFRSFVLSAVVRCPPCGAHFKCSARQGRICEAEAKLGQFVGMHESEQMPSTSLRQIKSCPFRAMGASDIRSECKGTEAADADKALQHTHICGGIVTRGCCLGWWHEHCHT